MLNLTAVIPDSLASILKNAVARRATSPDSVVTAELSQYFQTGRHRAYQVSTSAALVQGVSAGACLHGSSSLMETSVWEPLNNSTGTGACRRSRGLPAECEVVRASVRGQHFVRVLKKRRRNKMAEILKETECLGEVNIPADKVWACRLSRTPSYALAAKFRQLQLGQTS